MVIIRMKIVKTADAKSMIGVAKLILLTNQSQDT